MDYFRLQRHIGCRVLIALLASISLAVANPLIVVSGSPPVVAGGVLLTETFDATTEPSPPAGWTELGVVGWDATGLMEGTQHFITSSGGPPVGGSYTFAAQGTVEVFFWMRTSDATPSTRQRIAMLGDSGDAHGFEVMLETGGTVTIQDLGDNSDSTAGGATLADNTNTYFWLRYVKGTGANTALFSVGFSTTGTRPTSGSGFTSMSDGESTVDATKAQIARLGPATVQRYDRVIISTATIGDNP